MLIKPNLLVYVRRDNLIVGGPKIAPSNLRFPLEILDNLEILDEGRYIETVSNFFNKLDIGNKRSLVVLDPALIFEKTINLDSADKKTVKKLSEDYADMIPYPVGQRVSLRVEADKQLNQFTTNAKLYLCLIEGMRQAGVKKILAVTPAELYDLNYGLKASEFISQFLEDKQARKAADFLGATPF